MIFDSMSRIILLYLDYHHRLLQRANWIKTKHAPWGFGVLSQSKTKGAFTTSTPRYFLQVVALTSIWRQYASIAYDKD
jgi:hypothetical protein